MKNSSFAGSPVAASTTMLVAPTAMPAQLSTRPSVRVTSAAAEAKSANTPNGRSCTRCPAPSTSCRARASSGEMSSRRTNTAITNRHGEEIRDERGGPSDERRRREPPGVAHARAQVADEHHEGHLREDHHGERHVRPRVLGVSLLLIQNPLSGRFRTAGALTDQRATEVGEQNVRRSAQRSDPVHGVQASPPPCQPSRGSARGPNSIHNRHGVILASGRHFAHGGSFQCAARYGRRRSRRHRAGPRVVGGNPQSIWSRSSIQPHPVGSIMEVLWP